MSKIWSLLLSLLFAFSFLCNQEAKTLTARQLEDNKRLFISCLGVLLSDYYVYHYMKNFKVPKIGDDAFRAKERHTFYLNICATEDTPLFGENLIEYIIRLEEACKHIKYFADEEVIDEGPFCDYALKLAKCSPGVFDEFIAFLTNGDRPSSPDDDEDETILAFLTFPTAKDFSEYDDKVLYSMIWNCSRKENFIENIALEFQETQFS